MESLKIYIEMIYSGWFILPLYLFLVISTFIYICIKFNKKNLLNSWSISGSLIFLIFFYFIIPVPSTVQQREIRYIKKFLLNNDNPPLLNLKYVMKNECKSKYLKTYQYFLIKKAFEEDFEETFKKNKMVSMGGIDDKINYNEKKLCELNN